MGDDLISRLERLEHLASLLESGALTEAEFAKEKAKILGGAHTETIDDPPTEMDYTKVDTSTSEFESRPEPANPKSTARNAFLAIGVGISLVGFQAMRGGTSVSHEESHVTESAQPPSSGAIEEISDSFEDEIGVSSPSEMSCSSAMRIAMVAECGIYVEQANARYHPEEYWDSSVAQKTQGFDKSLREAKGADGCGALVSAGIAAAMARPSDLDIELASGQIDKSSARSICVAYGEMAIEDYCAYNPMCTEN